MPASPLPPPLTLASAHGYEGYSLPRRRSPPRVFLLDALGTLVTFADPVPRLRAGLRERLGVEIGIPDARRAMCAEIAFYRAHHDEARDRAGLAGLRTRCGALVARELGRAGVADAVTEVLVAAIAFSAYPEGGEVLAALRARGARLAVVSNWDVSLHDVLARLALRPLLDAVLTSAEEGVAKPDPELFRRALARLGARPGEAVHVGDSPALDLAGARAAGVEGVLVDRSGRTRGAITSLRALL